MAPGALERPAATGRRSAPSPTAPAAPPMSPWDAWKAAAGADSAAPATACRPTRCAKGNATRPKLARAPPPASPAAAAAGIARRTAPPIGDPARLRPKTARCVWSMSPASADAMARRASTLAWPGAAPNAAAAPETRFAGSAARSLNPAPNVARSCIGFPPAAVILGNRAPIHPGAVAARRSVAACCWRATSASDSGGVHLETAVRSEAGGCQPITSRLSSELRRIQSCR